MEFDVYSPLPQAAVDALQKEQALSGADSPRRKLVPLSSIDRSYSANENSSPRKAILMR